MGQRRQFLQVRAGAKRSPQAKITPVEKFYFVAGLVGIFDEPSSCAAPLPKGHVLWPQALESIHNFTVGNIRQPSAESAPKLAKVASVAPNRVRGLQRQAKEFVVDALM